MGKRALEHSSDVLELKYPYGNKRLRFSRMIYLSKENVELLNKNNIKEMPYVYVKPREEFLCMQASKENNMLNLEDYFESSSMAVALWSSKTCMVSVSCKASRELQFLNYFERLGWDSDLITDYCRTSHTDINTLMKELKVLFFSLKECNVNVDKIIEQCSKDKKNVKLFFEYLTKYLHSISTRKPVIVLEKIEIDPKLNMSQDVLKRKMQEISTADQNKVGKVNIETIVDTDYREIKRANRRKSCTGIREDLNVNKPFMPPYNFQQGINKSSLTMDKRFGKLLDSVEAAERGTDKEELSIHSEISEKPVGANKEDSCDQLRILKSDEKNTQLPNTKLTPQDTQDDSNHDAANAERSSSIQSTDSLKKSEAKIDVGIEQNISPESSEQVYKGSALLRRRGIRTKDAQQNIPPPLNSESTSKQTPSGKQTTATTNDTSYIEEETANESGDPSRNDESIEIDTKKPEHLICIDSAESSRLRKRVTRKTKGVGKNTKPVPNLETKSKHNSTGKQITIPTNDVSFIEKEGANESRDSSRNDESMDTSTKKREPSVTSDKIYTKSDCLRKRSTRGTEVVVSENDNGTALSLNFDATLKQPVTENISEIRPDIDDTVSGIKHPVSTISKDDSKEVCDANEIKTDTLDLKKIETESSFIPTENDRSVHKLGDSLKQTEVRKQTLQIENVLLINSEEYTKIKVGNENKDDAERNKDVDSESSFADQLKSGEENKHFMNKTQATKDAENEMGQNVDIESYDNTNLLRDSVESVLEESIDTDDNCFKTNGTIVGSTDVDGVRLSQCEFEGPTSNLKENESLIENDTISKRTEINKIVEGVKQMELNSNENENTSQYQAKSKSSHLGEQILEECAAIISNISPRKVGMSTNSCKETDVVLKAVTVKLNLLTSYLDGHGKNIEINRREMPAKVSDLRKADEGTESANKYSETKDLQEKMISFENSETTKKDEKREHVEDKNTNEFPVSFMDGQPSQGEEKTMKNANYSFNYLPSSQNSSKCSDTGIKVFEAKRDSVTDKEDIMKNSSPKRIETDKRSTVVTKRSFDIESLISLDEPRGRTDTFTEDKQFEKKSAETESYFGTFESTNSLKESDARIGIGMKEHILSKSDKEVYTANIQLRKRDNIKTQDTQKNIPLPLESKSKPTTIEKLTRMTTNDISFISEEMVIESIDLPRNDKRMEVDTEKREPLISSDGAETSRTRQRVTRKAKDITKNIELLLNLESKSKPTPTEKQVTISTNDACFTAEQTASESGDSLRNDERMEVDTGKREPLISSDSAGSSRLRKRVTRKTKDVDENIVLLPNSESKDKPTVTETHVTVPIDDTHSIEEQKASESGDSPRNDERMEVGIKKREPLISSDSAKNSRLRQRTSRKTRDVEKIAFPLNLDSKNKETPTGKQFTIPINDASSVEEETASESGDPLRNERMEVDTGKREPLISSDSAGSSRLRKRVTRKTKDVDENIVLLPNSESKDKPTLTETQVTVSTDDTHSIEEQKASESGDSPRNDERMEVGSKKREPLISSDSAKSSRLRQRTSRKTRDVEKIAFPLNLESKNKETPTGKQFTILINDACSVEEETASESGDPLRNDERMEVDTGKREPLISSDSAGSSRLRKRVTRKTKDVDENIVLLPNSELKDKPTLTETQVTVSTDDTHSIEEQKASESGDSPRTDERMEVGTKKREPLISSDSAKSSRLRQRTSRKTRDVEKIAFPLNLESKNKETPTGKQFTIPINDACSVEEETASESGDPLRNDERMEVDTGKREPLISSDSAGSSRLRKRVTRKTKDVDENIVLLPNSELKDKPTLTETQVTVSTDDTHSIEEQKASESGDSPRNDERMEVGTKKREPLISSDNAKSSRLRQRTSRNTRDVEKIAFPLNLESKNKETPTGKQFTIPINDVCSVEEETASESGDLIRNDESMKVDSEKQESLISSDKISTKRDCLRKRSTRVTKVVESENDNGTAHSLNSDTTRKQPVKENISEIRSDIDDTVCNDISEGRKTDESSVNKSTNLSSETKAETNDSLKAKEVFIDVGISNGSTETKIKSVKQGEHVLVRNLLIEDGTTVEINERKKSSESQRSHRRKELVVRVLRNQDQSSSEVDKNKSSKQDKNNVKITRNDEKGAVRDLRKYDEESTKADESERLTRNKNKVNAHSAGCDHLVEDLRNQQLEGDSKTLENGHSDTSELKVSSITIDIRDAAEDLRKQAEEKTKQSKGSSDNEISQFWCFPTKDSEKRSFEDVDSEMLSVDSQMPSSLYLRLESMNLDKEPIIKTTLCPDFKANGNMISCLYDTFQETDFSWQCYKLQASTAESPRSISNNRFLSGNGDVLQMLKIDDDIENQIFTGNDLSLLEGLNTGLPSLYPIQSASSVMSPRKVS